MHSSYPSRGRIAFETLCVLALAGSLAGAWIQTGATALLAAAGAAVLFGVSHAFGMKRPGLATAVEPRRIEFAPDGQDMPPAEPVAFEPEPEPAAAATVADEEPAPASRPKAPRKKRARAKVAEEPVIVDIAPAQEAEVEAPAIADSSPAGEDFDRPRIEPLFEPEPYVRQPREVIFGRKAG